MLELAFPLFTQLARQAVLAATQRLQCGLQRISWLDSMRPMTESRSMLDDVCAHISIYK